MDEEEEYIVDVVARPSCPDAVTSKISFPPLDAHLLRHTAPPQRASPSEERLAPGGALEDAKLILASKPFLSEGVGVVVGKVRASCFCALARKESESWKNVARRWRERGQGGGRVVGVGVVVFRRKFSTEAAAYA